MKLYTNNQGEWTGTQADARKQFKAAMRIVEVPTDKPSLLAFLNDNAVGSFEALGHKPEPEEEPLKFKMTHGPDGDVRLSRQLNPDCKPHRWDTIRQCAEEASFKDLGVALAVLMNRLDEAADKECK